MHESITTTGWNFDTSYAGLPEALHAEAPPVPVREPRIVVLNDDLARTLGLDPDRLRTHAAAVLSGNELPPGATPLAQAYAGHQFGHFTNLGDGRAILLGEQITPAGDRVDLQLKGAGRTRYSRGGDGRAALGPMLREFVISEAMQALGIPTTRSLAVVATGEAVLRATPLPGAVLTRVAASHIRVGTFQYAAARGEPGLLAALLDYTLRRHDPALVDAPVPPLAFLEAVVERQAALVARWMLVGFVHGVMNTDNMAISGETIDYGPCAFLDRYDPATVFSSIDHQGRYAYGNQPGIAHWNLARLAESLLPLVPGTEAEAIEGVKGVLATFPERFSRRQLALGREKLGLVTTEDGDAALFTDLLRAVAAEGADFTSTFAGLADQATAATADTAPPAVAAWLPAWRARLGRQPLPPAEAAARMRRVNPLVIPRNHRVEEALAAAEAGDLAPFTRLVAAVRRPFDATPDTAPFRGGPPPGCGPYRTFCGT